MKIPDAFFGKHHLVRKKLTPVVRHLLKHKQFPADFLENCIETLDVKEQNPKVALHHRGFFPEETHFRLYRFWDVIYHEFDDDTSHGLTDDNRHFLFNVLLPYPWGILAIFTDSALIPDLSEEPNLARILFAEFITHFEAFKYEKVLFEHSYFSSRAGIAFWNQPSNSFFRLMCLAGVPETLINARENLTFSDDEIENWIKTYIL